jgi:hypothetical protein
VRCGDVHFLDKHSWVHKLRSGELLGNRGRNGVSGVPLLQHRDLLSHRRKRVFNLCRGLVQQRHLLLGVLSVLIGLLFPGRCCKLHGMRSGHLPGGHKPDSLHKLRSREFSIQHGPDSVRELWGWHVCSEHGAGGMR